MAKNSSHVLSAHGTDQLRATCSMIPSSLPSSAALPCDMCVGHVTSPSLILLCDTLLSAMPHAYHEPRLVASSLCAQLVAQMLV
jgi:hypothetical protein